MASNKGALVRPVSASTPCRMAAPPIHICVTMRMRLRFHKSARAPKGRPKSSSGKVVAACTSATHSGTTRSSTIIQAADTPHIQTHMFDSIHMIHSERNAG